MSIIKTIPVEKIINGNKVRTSESAIVSEGKYSTNGEYAIVIRGVDNCDLQLNSNTTDPKFPAGILVETFTLLLSILAVAATNTIRPFI